MMDHIERSGVVVVVVVGQVNELVMSSEQVKNERNHP